VTLSLRPLAPEDAQAVADLVGDYDACFNGVEDRPTADDILDWWRRVDCGSIGVADAAGRVVGAGALQRRGAHVVADNFVHPDARGRGAGSLLLDWTEGRAAEEGAASIRAGTAAADADGKDLLGRRGYRYVRTFFRMTVDLEDPPPAPVWPEGFRFDVDPDAERTIHETLEEAFAEHWGHEPRTFDDWAARHGPLSERLCYLVWSPDDDVAAAQICDEDRFGTAWIAVLGVRSRWRRHGLGEALLRQAFHDLYARGRKRIALGVDADNATGATRLYERVGMTVSSQDDVYEKTLGRAG
jgi:mycothiol synthase